MSIKDITQEKLDSFTGTEGYRWSDFKRLKLTDGAAFLQDNGAAWLITAIESYQGIEKFKNVEFQLWELTLTGEKMLDGSGAEAVMAALTCKEDSDQPILVRQEIPYTDFPLDSIKLYVQNGVLLLPSEY
jgi:hypothetical protein